MRLFARRHVLRLLVSTAASALSIRQTLSSPLDQGIGGTGAAPPPTEDQADRGIGGTGVIGTIRKFGSIIVNDMRIAYAPDATVRIDGEPASISDLKIGQVVRVAADGGAGSLSTRVIDVTSEVVGPVERVGSKQIVVLGQTVSTAALKQRRFAVGDRVAVSGLRRNDGTIVASLVEPRPEGPNRVAGPVRVAADGSLRIGGLATPGVDPSLIDRRARLEGQVEGDRFVVTHTASEASLLPPSVTRLSIESYVERRGGDLSLGSGFIVSGTNGIDIRAGQSVRAVFNTTVGPNGLSLVNVRQGGRTYAAPGGDRRGPGSRGERGNGAGGGPGGGQRGPMDGRGAGGDGRGDGGGGPGGGPGGPGGRGFGGGGFGGGGFGGGRR